MSFRVDMEPIGRRAEASDTDSLLEVAQAAGVQLAAICGGIGACDTCRIHLIEGKLSRPTLSEEGEFSPEQIRAGWRLACQSFPLSDVKIDIPPESLALPQRLQLEGEDQHINVDPLIATVDVRLPAPTALDLRSDMTRLNDTLHRMGLPMVLASVPMLGCLSERLRAAHWTARLAIRQQTTVVGVLPTDCPPLGLAFDVGTTSIAAYLLDLTTGAMLAKSGTMNPQIAYGEDVISRIRYINQHSERSTLLQECVVGALNEMAEQLCARVSATVDEVVDVVIVGNTVMHHIVSGLPVRQLGEAPYVPAQSDGLEFPALSIGLKVSPGAVVYMPPNIAGYVGADHIAALLSMGLGDAHTTRLIMDIGTNTEVTLVHRGECYSCSCASGPAFEGAHIRDGMRAASGAIERLEIKDNHIYMQTIDNVVPVGICGSGVLDAVAAMAECGLVGKHGAFRSGHPLLKGDGKHGFVIAPPETTVHGRSIVITRKDVAEIQLAKSAIRTGIDLLMERADIGASDIQEFVLAGAFGTYIHVSSALKIGMFPAIPAERIKQIGNAAGMGATHLLVSRALREEAQQFARRINYIELTTHPRFQDVFVENLDL